MDENRLFLTVKQAAAVAGVHPHTIHAWIRAGKLPAGKIGRSYTIEEARLLELLRGGPER